MSGASGKIPAAIHTSPEALLDGDLARIEDGDMILLDIKDGKLQALVDEKIWQKRSRKKPKQKEVFGAGRELFASFRANSSSAETGAMSFGGIFS